MRYIWVANTLKPGTYYARVIPRGTIRTVDLVDNIAARTLLDGVDVATVLAALRDEVVEGLAAGRSVILDDFLGFSVGLELNHADQATTPQLQLKPDDVLIRVNVTAKSGVLRRVQNRLSIELLDECVRMPRVREVFDHGSRTTGQYSPGGVVEVRGWDLELPGDFERDPTQGVFFCGAERVALRAEVYIRPSDKVITCVVPGEVFGEVAVEVRSTYGRNRLARGRIDGVRQIRPTSSVGGSAAV